MVERGGEAFVNPRCVARFPSSLYLFINGLLPFHHGEKRFLFRARMPGDNKLHVAYEEVHLCFILLFSGQTLVRTKFPCILVPFLKQVIVLFAFPFFAVTFVK